MGNPQNWLIKKNIENRFCDRQNYSNLCFTNSNVEILLVFPNGILIFYNTHILLFYIWITQATANKKYDYQLPALPLSGRIPQNQLRLTKNAFFIWVIFTLF